MKPKYQDVAKVLKSRIEHGDYINIALPSERRIAEEQQVSYMTARRAVLMLIEEGLAKRCEDGRTVASADWLNGGEEGQIKSFAFISPAYVSLLTQQWYAAVERCLAGQKCVLRPMYFAHWEDSSIIETAERSDGIFLLPTLDPVPQRIVERLGKCGKPLVVLSRDWSGDGFVSIAPRPVESMELLLEHLYSLGHRKIDCFNTQPLDDTIRQSFDFWRGWLSGRSLKGDLYNDPVEPYSDTLEQAYSYAKRLIESGAWNSKALLCMTLTAAIGAMRAMSDCGLKPGADTAVCTINGVGYARYLTPSLTSLVDTPLDPFAARAASWMISGGKPEDWEGPLSLSPKKLQLFIGESTQAAGTAANQEENAR